jgi:hypothetical protein
MRVVCAEQGRLDEVAPEIERRAELHDAWRVDPLYHLTKLDRKAEVVALFERLAAHDFADLPRDMFSLWNLAYLAEACVYLRDSRRAVLLYDLLLPHADRCLVMGQAVEARVRSRATSGSSPRLSSAGRTLPASSSERSRSTPAWALDPSSPTPSTSTQPPCSSGGGPRIASGRAGCWLRRWPRRKSWG